MAQHDYVIANGTGAAVRSDLNNALAAIVSQNSGATAPSTTYAYQWWADTTTGLLKLRNAANNGWITLFQLDGEWSTLAVENGSAAAPSIYFKDSGTDTGIYSPGTDQVAISTGGTGRLFVDSSGRVGLGSSSPSTNFELRGSGTSIAGVNTHALISDSTTAASGVGGSILFEGNYTSGGARAVYAGIAGTKENGTDSDYAGNLKFYTRANGSLPALAMTITSSQRVGIGSTSDPGGIGSRLWIDTTGDTYFSANSTGSGNIAGIHFRNSNANGEARIVNNTGGALTFYGNVTTERARIDSSGRLLVGTSTARSNFLNTTLSSTFQIEGTSHNTSGISVVRNESGEPAHLTLAASRGTTIGSNTIVQNNDTVGSFSFQGNDGSEFVELAAIKAAVDGTPGANDMPGRIVLSTTADGASSPTERMRINQTGNVWIGNGGNPRSSGGAEIHTAGYIYTNVDSGPAAYFNRITNDGVIVELRQDNTIEGSISVSGTTVSYNGAHLSRWSQLPGGAERTEILRGTVLSNTDEMCEWGDEENEQLNRMKVSDVEGDPNVAGVFQAWDDDDDTYTDDFYCAMTGDFIIRIAEGVTVQRGDLLMSAGDGTAIPQDDDIVRSKTVAKVTSHHVTCTYDDGSYCVPCVLMAC